MARSSAPKATGRAAGGGGPARTGGAGTEARYVALEALARIDDGAFANLVLPGLLGRSRLSGRDRRFVTELVYGVTRMRRALDDAIDPHLRGGVQSEVRSALRLGAYQLLFMELPAHAAVSTTVDCAPPRARGLVNAVLRKVAGTPPHWDDVASELSYPDWLLARLEADLGIEPARSALAWMNRPAAVSARDDGVVQDRASQWVVEYAAARHGETVADVCAGPGGKTTGMARTGAGVVTACDVNERRAGLVRANAERLEQANVSVFVGDADAPALRDRSFDLVLVDAPCSGLGVLRRRPDARWRIDPGAPERLAALQRSMLASSARLVRPGGRLVYSVCTLTRAETIDVDAWAQGLPDPSDSTDISDLSDFSALPPPGPPWRAFGRGGLLLPQDADTDGMFVLGLQRAG